VIVTAKSVKGVLAIRCCFRFIGCNALVFPSVDVFMEWL